VLRSTAKNGQKFYLGIAVLVLRARVVKVYLLVLLVPFAIIGKKWNQPFPDWK
jgi:hypothetical protein